MNLTMSYQSIINTLDKMGDHHDKEVLQWRDSLQKVWHFNSIKHSCDLINDRLMHAIILYNIAFDAETITTEPYTS